MTEQSDHQLAALKREREGYERYGRSDRADQVTAEIKKLEKSLGEKPKQASVPATDQVTRTGDDASGATPTPAVPVTPAAPATPPAAPAKKAAAKKVAAKKTAAKKA